MSWQFGVVGGVVVLWLVWRRRMVCNILQSPRVDHKM